MKRENSFFLKSRGAQVLNTIQSDLPITLGIWTGIIPVIITNSFVLIIVSFRLIAINYTVYALSVLLLESDEFIQGLILPVANIVSHTTLFDDNATDTIILN